jgi:predicted PurR-regulated permease PerM
LNAQMMVVLVYLTVVVAFAFGQRGRERTPWILGFGIGLLLLVSAVMYFGELLLPFVIALLLAYLLDPLLDALQRRGVRRVWAIVMVYIALFGLATVAVVVLLPPVFEQLKAALGQLAAIDWQKLADPVRFEAWIVEHVDRLPIRDAWRAPLVANIHNLFREFEPQISQLRPYIKEAATWAYGRATGILSALASLGWMILLPLTLWYSLADYDRLRRRLWHLVAPENRAVAASLAASLNRAMGGYLRGYAALCLITGVVMTTVLLVLQRLFGFQYGLLIGIIAGAIYFIPYIGMLTGVILTVTAIYFTGGFSIAETLIGFGIVEAYYLVFDNAIVPRVIGHSTGIHPMLVLLALLAGGKLAGVAGIILATPLLMCAKIVAEHIWPRLGEPLDDDGGTGDPPVALPGTPIGETTMPLPPPADRKDETP